jgi:uncharacterized membrane protein YphA (DoxX/SURF4 family)
MNSKAAQLTENGTEAVRLFARLAIGASFLSAVADRFGLWGPYGAKHVSWGDFAHFVEYTGAVTSLFPSSLTVSFAWAATIAETLLGILLIAGFNTRMVSVLSGLLLLSFAMGMATGLGIKAPIDYSVFSAAAATFLLAFWEPDRFTLDRLLREIRSRTTLTSSVNAPRNRHSEFKERELDLQETPFAIHDVPLCRPEGGSVCGTVVYRCSIERNIA